MAIFPPANSGTSPRAGSTLRFDRLKVRDLRLDLGKNISSSDSLLGYWIGKLPIYLTLTKVKIEPEKVIVLGGRSILERISTLYTEKVRLDTIENSGKITAKLALQPASLKIAQGPKKRIYIAYEVKSKFLEEVKEE